MAGPGCQSVNKRANANNVYVWDKGRCAAKSGSQTCYKESVACLDRDGVWTSEYLKTWVYIGST